MKTLFIFFPQTWVLLNSPQWLWHHHLAHGTDGKPRTYPLHHLLPHYPPPIHHQLLLPTLFGIHSLLPQLGCYTQVQTATISCLGFSRASTLTHWLQPLPPPRCAAARLIPLKHRSDWTTPVCKASGFPMSLGQR